MQYKIPIQIENEDTIVLGLSLRQLIIIMVWAGVAYGIFKYMEPRVGAELSLVIAIPLVVLGVAVAIVRISEMTFLPLILNLFRLSLNAKSRPWVQGTDSFSELEIGFIAPEGAPQTVVSNKSFTEAVGEKDEFAERLKNL